jgi:hypothetical protein
VDLGIAGSNPVIHPFAPWSFGRPKTALRFAPRGNEPKPPANGSLSARPSASEQDAPGALSIIAPPVADGGSGGPINHERSPHRFPPLRRGIGVVVVAHQARE